VGPGVLFISGWIASRLLGGYRPADVERLTYWHRRAASDPSP
jgi:hypothetical protein